MQQKATLAEALNNLESAGLSAGQARQTASLLGVEGLSPSMRLSNEQLFAMDVALKYIELAAAVLDSPVSSLTAEQFKQLMFNESELPSLIEQPATMFKVIAAKIDASRGLDEDVVLAARYEQAASAAGELALARVKLRQLTEALSVEQRAAMASIVDAIHALDKDTSGYRKVMKSAALMASLWAGYPAVASAMKAVSSGEKRYAAAQGEVLKKLFNSRKGNPSVIAAASLISAFEINEQGKQWFDEKLYTRLIASKEVVMNAVGLIEPDKFVATPGALKGLAGLAEGKNTSGIVLRLAARDSVVVSVVGALREAVKQKIAAGDFTKTEFTMADVLKITGALKNVAPALVIAVALGTSMDAAGDVIKNYNGLSSEIREQVALSKLVSPQAAQAAASVLRPDVTTPDVEDNKPVSMGSLATSAISAYFMPATLAQNESHHISEEVLKTLLDSVYGIARPREQITGSLRQVLVAYDSAADLFNALGLEVVPDGLGYNEKVAEGYLQKCKALLEGLKAGEIEPADAKMQLGMLSTIRDILMVRHNDESGARLFEKVIEQIKANDAGVVVPVEISLEGQLPEVERLQKALYIFEAAKGYEEQSQKEIITAEFIEQFAKTRAGLSRAEMEAGLKGESNPLAVAFNAAVGMVPAAAVKPMAAARSIARSYYPEPDRLFSDALEEIFSAERVTSNDKKAINMLKSKKLKSAA